VHHPIDQSLGQANFASCVVALESFLVAEYRADHEARFGHTAFEAGQVGLVPMPFAARRALLAAVGLMSESRPVSQTNRIAPLRDVPDTITPVTHSQPPSIQE
jgi:hypothetical protein